MWSVLARPTPIVLIALVSMTVLRWLHLAELEANSVLFAHPMVDALEYLEAAKARASDTFRYAVPMHGPLFPELLGVAYALCGGEPFWLHLLASLVGQLTVLVLYFGGRNITGRWPAAIAAVLFALYRPGLLYECEYYAAGLANLLVTVVAVLLAGWSLAGGSWGRVLALGVAVGMAVITRTNLLVLLPVVLFVVWRGGGSRRQWLVLAGLALFPASLYTAHNFAVSGSFIFVQARGGQNLAMANHPAATGLVDIRPGPTFEAVRRRPMVQAQAYGLAAQDRYHFEQFLDYLAADPGAFGALLLRKACNSCSPIETPSAYDNESNAEFSWLLRLPLPGFGWLLPLAMVGVVAGLSRCLVARRPYVAPVLVLVLVGVAVWLTMLLVFPTGRYRYQLAGLLCLFAGCGLRVVTQAIRGEQDGSRRGWVLALAVGGVGIVGVLLAPRFHQLRPQWRAEHKQLQAYSLLGKRDLAAARRLAVAADELDPTYAWPQFLLGVLASHGTAGKPGGAGADFAAAVKHYTLAIGRLAEFPEAFENRAYIIMRLGHYDHALRGFRKAVELMPFRYQSWGYLAQIYKLQGKNVEAARCQQRAAEAAERLKTMPWVR